MTALSPRTKELLTYLGTQRYYNLRVIEDEIIIGCADMLFTTAVCLNLNFTGFESRVCYPTKRQALECCNTLVNMDDAPLPGYSAIK